MSAEKTVRDFIKAWAAPGNLASALRQYMTPDCAYENVGMSDTTGPEEAIAFFDSLADVLPVTHIKVDILGLMAAGNQVMTERVDHLLDQDGNVLASIRLMGVFDVSDGKISAWRDYFDTAPFAALQK